MTGGMGEAGEGMTPLKDCEISQLRLQDSSLSPARKGRDMRRNSKDGLMNPVPGRNIANKWGVEPVESANIGNTSDLSSTLLEDAKSNKKDASASPILGEDESKRKDMVDSAFTEKEHQQLSSADEADDSTCAICLKRIPLAEIAQPVGCDHVYCTCCLLHWASFKDKPWCPQCKTPFSSIHTFHTLDGQLHDHPAQEAIALLKCTDWFRDYVKMKEQTAAAAVSLGKLGRPEGSVIDESDYVDYARYYQEYDDDEEVEDYYFSSAAGRARVVIGNRRHGPNGYMSSGRMQARPNPPQTPSGKGKAGGGQKSAPRSVPSKAQGTASGKKKKPSIRLDTDDESDDCGSARRPQSMGRRAKRNQRKAVADRMSL